MKTAAEMRLYTDSQKIKVADEQLHNQIGHIAARIESRAANGQYFASFKAWPEYYTDWRPEALNHFRQLGYKVTGGLFRAVRISW